MIKVTSATKEGFEIANEGDSINLSMPESKTRRGRVGKKQAQTLDTQSNQAVVIHVNPSTESGGKQPYQQNRVYAADGLAPTIDQAAGKWSITNTNIAGDQFENEHAGTIRAGASSNYQLVNNIRRLTEIECERLQGFQDNHTAMGNYDGVIKPISKSQRYKLCGNAVTVDVVEMVGRKLFDIINP